MAKQCSWRAQELSIDTALCSCMFLVNKPSSMWSMCKGGAVQAFPARGKMLKVKAERSAVGPHDIHPSYSDPPPENHCVTCACNYRQ